MATPDIVEVILGPATNTVEVLVPGIRGPAGPNSISLSTATALTGILRANGTAISIAVPGTDYLNNFDFVNADGSQRFSVYQPPSTGNGYASLYFNSEGSSEGFQPLAIGANAEEGFYVGHGATQLAANAVSITINAPVYSIGYPSAFRTALGAQATLPSMTGQSGKFLTNNGTVESWGTIDLSTKQDAAAFLTTLAAINSTSGTGALARVTSPTLTTPTIARTNFSANTNVTEQASGIVQIGTTVANALGSLACAQVNLGTATEFIQLGGTLNKVIGAYSNALGYSYQLIGDSTAGGGPMLLKMGSGAVGCWQSTTRADAGTTDLAYGRDSAGVFGIYTDQAKTIKGSLACANVTASGTGAFGAYLSVSSAATYAMIQGSAGGTNGLWLAHTTPGSIAIQATGSAYDNLNFGASGRIAFSNAAVNAYSATKDTSIGRDSAGVIGFYTSSTGATKADISCANVTASGVVTASGTGTHTFGTTNTVTMASGVLTTSGNINCNGFLAFPANTEKIVPSSNSGLYLEVRSNLGLASRNNAGSGFSPFWCSSLSATDIAATPVTFAGLPPASSKTGKSIQVSDRDYAIATSNGTNWLRAGTSTVLT